MLDFFMQVQQSAGGGGGGGGDAFNMNGSPPVTPTHFLLQPATSNSPYGFEIWDISNPASPSLSTTYNLGPSTKYSPDPPNAYPYRRSLCIKNNVAYFDATSSTVYAMDVSNPSSLSASNELGSFSTEARLLVAAHPTKDVLWTIHEDAYVKTWDISNPASISLIAEVLSPRPTTNGRAAAISFDGEYLFRQNNFDLEVWGLNASNEPYLITQNPISAWSTSSLMPMTYVEGASGNVYIVSSIYNLEYIQVAEFDSSFNMVDHWQVTDYTNADDARWHIAMPYASNYTSDELAFALYESDDSQLNVLSSNPQTSNTVTHQAATSSDPTYIGANSSSFDVFDQYIISVNGDSRRISVWEWSALNTINRIAAIDSTTTPATSVYTSKICLYAP